MALRRMVRNLPLTCGLRNGVSGKGIWEGKAYLWVACK
jgi:hypothetical protein